MKTQTLNVEQLKYLAENGIAYLVAEGREVFVGPRYEAVELASGLFQVNDHKAKADPAWGLSATEAALFCTEKVATVATRRDALRRITSK